MILAERVIRVTAPSRLHFGMLSFGQPGRRQFGGAGAMIAEPSLKLTIAGSDRLRVSGPLADRVEQVVNHLWHHAAWCRDPNVYITIESAPPQHAGLGSGTQLGMALARGLAAWFKAPPQTPDSLARAAGRGKRSAVGIYGACLGGLIVEGGKLTQEEISPLVSRVALRDEWRFVLILPRERTGLSGEAEQRAFDRLPAVPPETTAALCRELVCELVPAAVSDDFERFSEALYRYGRLAGQCFAAHQGGAYSSPAAEHLVERCRALGVQGVGQSSWGPTVFVLCRDQRQAEELLRSLDAAGELAGATTFITSPDNHGVAIEG